MSNTQTPYVVLIDLDGTIQGDVMPQLREFNLIKSLKLKTSLNKSHRNDYIKGLLRPYFTNFIKHIKSKYDGKVELFIYTASDKVWAHHVVPIIESIVGFKFNRPIFTREHCDNGTSYKTKSIKHIKNHVIKSLQPKYAKNIITEQTLVKKIFLIDNNHVLEDTKQLIKCYTYDKAIFVNILRNIPENVIHERFRDIGNYLLNTECSSEWEMRKLIYDDAFKKFVDYENKNKSYENDTYWKKVTLIFTKNELDLKTIIKHLKRLE